MNNEEILVSIRCETFNQEKYISNCLDGFVMQKTNFKYEIVVHDDASTDNTANIIREYEKKYPNLIRPIYEEENQYSKHDNSIRKLLDSEMRGKYIAICEGDDYWTDPLKLQKQIDFLENNPDYSMCFHQAIRHYEDCNKKDELYGDIEDRDYTGLELYSSSHRPPTASVVMRTSINNTDVYKDFVKYNLSFGDIPLFLTCAHYGKVRGMADIMCVYRKHQGGMSAAFESINDQVLIFAEDNLKLYKIFGKKYKTECVKIYTIDYLNHFFRCRKQGKTRPILIIKPLLRYPFYTIRFLYDRIHNHYKSY